MRVSERDGEGERATQLSNKEPSNTTHPDGLIHKQVLGPLLLDEPHVRAGQRLWHHQERVHDLAACAAHQQRVPVCQPRGCQHRVQPGVARTAARRVASTDQQRETSQQDVRGKAVVPVLGTAACQTGAARQEGKGGQGIPTRNLLQVTGSCSGCSNVYDNERRTST